MLPSERDSMLTWHGCLQPISCCAESLARFYQGSHRSGMPSIGLDLNRSKPCCVICHCFLSPEKDTGLLDGQDPF